MANEMLVYVGTYTEPIRFGTGKILQGKGRGYTYIDWINRQAPWNGSVKTTGVTNPSYLAFDSTRRFLYAVNELKTYEDKPTGTISAFAVDPKTGKLRVPEQKADPWDRSMPCPRG